MKQLILWLIAVLGACCLGYDNNGGQTGDQASNDDGDESGDPTPAAVVVITDKDVELSASQTKTFSWTSPTGPGTLTARVTWSTSEECGVYVDQTVPGGPQGWDEGTSPAVVSLHVSAAGEVWIIGVYNNSHNNVTVHYRLTFQP